MFSGIIEKKGKILEVNGGRFKVENHFGENLVIGQSIAHDGACMTIEKFDKESYTFFAMEESFKKTNFSDKKEGNYFNIERCLKVGDRIDGHFVTGHVDIVGEVLKLEKNEDGSLDFYVKFDRKHRINLIPKGSVTINGVSLTIVELGEDFLSVSLIPLTQEMTNLGDMVAGNKVNLEFDMLGKYIINLKKNDV